MGDDICCYMKISAHDDLDINIYGNIVFQDTKSL